MRFLVDAQLPPQLARALTQAGYHAEHIEDAGLRHANDAAIWEYAVRVQAIILTKDEDFVERFRRQANTPIIVWIRIGNATNAVLLGWFLPLLPAIATRIQSGDRLIEIR